MTGLEFDNLFDQKTDKAYTAYLDSVKKERLYKMALFEAIEQKYLAGDKQKIYDELRNIIVTDASQSVVNNEVAISDYMHLLAMKVRYDKQIATITAVSTGTPTTITLNVDTNLRTGQYVFIPSSGGTTGLTGLRYLKKVGKRKFQLYTNRGLDNLLTTSGVYTGGVPLRVVYENWAKPLFPDKKFSPYCVATIRLPYYEEADGVFKLFPEDETPVAAYVDYVSSPSVFIDPTDNTTDLEDTYPYKFLLYILDTAVKLFAGPTRDNILYQLESKEIIDNP
jgi:hypothetical protein